MRKIFVRGLYALIPIALTIGIVSWLYNVFENLLGTPLKYFLGSHYYHGMGIAAGLILAFCFGAILNSWLVQKLYGAFEKLIGRIPLVKTLYGSITDFMSFFRGRNTNEGTQQVVMASFQGVQLIGLVTREQFDDLPAIMGKPDEIIVFFPMSYQIGGFTVVLPRTMVRKIDMSFEEAMRFVVTAGVLSKKEEPPRP